jgi:PAS domain-containing protein
MKRVFFGSLVAATTVLPNSGNAQSTNEQFLAVRACTSAIQNGDTETVRELGEQMLEWEGIIGNVLGQVQECVAVAFDGEYQYRPSLGFARGSALAEFDAEREAIRAEQEIRRSEAVLRDLLSTLSDLYELRNENLVTESVNESCLDLAATDPDSAFTNQTCVSSFRRNGHPELPSFAAFAVSASPFVLDGLQSRERELLEGLTQ